jgi:deoxyribose-phosphate aldolase
MELILENFPVPAEFAEIDNLIMNVKNNIPKEFEDINVLKLLFNCIDLTSLNTIDSTDTITTFVEKVNRFADTYPEMPEVAAICVFPVFSSVLKKSLKRDGVKKAVVSAGFPSSQTFTDVKKLETKRAVEFGANEIDIVLSVGEFLEGNYDFVYEEIISIKNLLKEIHLKVILETGALKTPEQIWMASLLSMEAGADFIKTSTGKMQPAATPEAFYVMARAVKAYHTKTGKKVGLKAAGGISTASEALVYYTIIKDVLGNDWLNNDLFRIGASRLANNLLSDIVSIEKGEKEDVMFF